MAKQSALEESRLGATSRALARALFALDEGLRASAQMEMGAEPDGHSLVLNLDSPTGDATRRLGVWIDESGVPSIGFGEWHSHGDVLSDGHSGSAQVDAIADLLGAILRDKFVLIMDLGGAHPGHTSVLDLRIRDALPQELTSKFSPGRILIKSWSGKADGEVGLDELRL
jgi:hypothetical protein